MHWLRSRLVTRLPAHRSTMVRSYATRIERVATLALLDGERGAALAHRVLRETHSEADTVRALLRRLPTTVRSSSASSSNGEQSLSDNVIAVLRPWTPRTRAMLGLALWGDLDSDDLVTLSGDASVMRSVADSIVAVGDVLGTMPPTGISNACRGTEATILAAALADHETAMRGHAVGCAACRARLTGFRETVSLLRSMLQARFPLNMEPATTSEEAQPRQLSSTRKILALLAVVLLASGALVVGHTPRQTTAVAVSLLADDILQRAATRFDAAQPAVLYERYSMTGQLSLRIERWSDVAHGRLRVVVRNQQDQREHPMLDLVVDGERLHYAISSDEIRTTTFEHPQVPDLLPMLWMLPDGGGLGSFPLVQRGTDGSFIRAARLYGARSLGTTRVDGRTAYLLSYRQPENTLWQEPAQEIVLAFDTATYALLRASDIGTTERARTRILWQAEALETMTEAPAATFDAGTDTPLRALPNPRLLTFGAFTNLRLNDVPSSYGMMPVPATVPDGTTLMFLREENTPAGIMQVYEGKDATVALITSPPPLPSISLRRLQNRTGDTFWDVLDEQNNITQVELIRTTDPTHRTRLYVWHATMDAAQRRVVAEAIVASIRWVRQGSADVLGERFEDAAAR